MDLTARVAATLDSKKIFKFFWVAIEKQSCCDKILIDFLLNCGCLSQLLNEWLILC